MYFITTHIYIICFDGINGLFRLSEVSWSFTTKTYPLQQPPINHKYTIHFYYNVIRDFSFSFKSVITLTLANTKI